MTSVPTTVRLLGVRPYEPGCSSIKRAWMHEAAQQLSDEAFAAFMYLASIAQEPGCTLSPAPDDVARHFRARARNMRRGYHELQERGVMRIVGDAYELADEWGYFA